MTIMNQIPTQMLHSHKSLLLNPNHPFCYNLSSSFYYQHGPPHKEITRDLPKPPKSSSPKSTNDKKVHEPRVFTNSVTTFSPCDPKEFVKYSSKPTDTFAAETAADIVNDVVDNVIDRHTNKETETPLDSSLSDLDRDDVTDSFGDPLTVASHSTDNLDPVVDHTKDTDTTNASTPGVQTSTANAKSSLN